MRLAPHVLVETSLDGITAGDVLELAGTTRHHLQRVLRLGAGTVVSLTDGRGHRVDGRFEGDHVVVSGHPEVWEAARPCLVLGQAVSKGRRAEDAVRVACELGVDRIVPVLAARTQHRPDRRGGEVLVERWRAVAVGALEQSRGVRLPVIDDPVADLTSVAGDESKALRLIAVPGAPALPDALDGAAAERRTVPCIAVLVGPEGGWTPEEVAATGEAGWVPVGLGPTILRTEHAGPVAIAVIAAMLGRWRTAR